MSTVSKLAEGTPARAHKRNVSAIMSTTALSAAVLLANGIGAPVFAQAAPPASVEEIVVTGSRIVREGYEAPTPLTVVGAEQLQNSGAASMITYLTELPALAGSGLPNTNLSSTTNAGGGGHIVNLRGMGVNRTLVLLDGQRVVGLDYNGAVSISALPQQLLERVDIVTGGASAVYGADAVAGVINFILDKDFSGVKGEVSGGVTGYGDDRNYKVNLSSGFGFAEGRGHVLLSGEHVYSQGVLDGKARPWNFEGWAFYTNPTYTATNGQPQNLILNQSALGGASAGGTVFAGPLKGLAFGEGGTPYTFNFGDIYSEPYIHGGDWMLSDSVPNASIQPRQTFDSLFTRVAYDITDNVNVFVQYSWSQSRSMNIVNKYWRTGGAAPFVAVDNAFLAPTVRAAMIAAGLTRIQVGTWNKDVPAFGPNNTSIQNRVESGLEGSFDAFNTAWHWNAAYNYSTTDQSAHSGSPAKGTPTYNQGFVTSLYNQAVDAVFHPVTGQIVCRIALTNPATACKPWNIMGTGVNDPKNISFFRDNFQYGVIKLESYSASITGEPFSSWAGPVGVALSAEHRTDSITSRVDPEAAIFDRPTGSHSALNGSRSVTEGAVEVIVPLAAGETWAQTWDLSAAARATDYSSSGYVTTWKIGSTYSPTDDFTFRVTYSRDIRAPNLQELFATPNTAGFLAINDHFLGRSYVGDRIFNASNPNLLPEKSNTLGVGVVLQPAFLEGFGASIDFWQMDIKEAIQPINAQQVMDTCFDGRRPDLCVNIERNPATGLVTAITQLPINFAIQNVRGLDLESSYRVAMSTFNEAWDGSFSIHGNMTFYLRNYLDNRFETPADRVGENVSFRGSNQIPNWKFTATASYTLDPFMVSLTMRGISSGKYDSRMIECTSGCPTSTFDKPTINFNHQPGKMWFDAALNYNFAVAEKVDTTAFFTVKNIFNVDPVYSGGSFLAPQATSAAYDYLGTVYRIGVRFRM